MYNRNEVLKAIQTIKNFNITVDKKVFHLTRLEEVRDLLHSLMSINQYLFDPDYQYNFLQYKRSIECKDTKKELDNKLKLCINAIGRELVNILNVIDTCTYDEEKQKYVEV